MELNTRNNDEEAGAEEAEAAAAKERAICLGIHEFLGPANKRFLAEARTALEQGDGPALGATMVAFQQAFDVSYLQACSS